MYRKVLLSWEMGEITDTSILAWRYYSSAQWKRFAESRNIHGRKNRRDSIDRRKRQLKLKITVGGWAWTSDQGSSVLTQVRSGIVRSRKLIWGSVSLVRLLGGAGGIRTPYLLTASQAWEKAEAACLLSEHNSIKLGLKNQGIFRPPVVSSTIIGCE